MMTKTKFYYVWIEGFSPMKGEKLFRLTDYGYDICTSMADAMRVKPEHVHLIRAYLKRHGVAEWALESAFQAINYAPTGTIYKP
jgi:hypothetical protein